MRQVIDDDGTNPPDITGKSPDRSGQTGELPGLRSKSGRFLPGNRANPKGRPKGSLNQATIFARALLQEAGPAIARKAIDMAKQGNATAMKLVIERLLPLAHDRSVNLELPQPGGTPGDILASHTELLRSVAQGEVTPQEALAISQLLEARRRSWETTEFAQRIETIKDHAAENARRQRQKGTTHK